VAVNRTELVEVVATNAEIDRKVAEKAVMALIDTVIAQTKAGEKVSVFGFGTFNPTSRGARTGRNPRTNEPVKIAASKGVRFAPAAAFKAALNTKAAGKKAAAAKKAPIKKAAAATKATAAKATAKTAPAKATAKAPATAKKASVSTAKKAAKSTRKK
jgi:DNA-binding protein HU-beta